MAIGTLEPERYVVDIDITKAYGLPPDAFNSKRFLARELATVFRKNWLLVPECDTFGETPTPYTSIAELLKNNDSVLPAKMLGEPIFLSRGSDGSLRAFSNVCSHQWYPVVQKRGRHPNIVCGQHARVFDTSGKCVRQRGFEHCQNFPSSTDDLTEFSLAEWQQFVFMSFEKPQYSLETMVMPLRMGSPPRFPFGYAHSPRAGAWLEVDGNWKLHAQNYLDHFHIPTIHRSSLAEAIDLDSYRIEFNGSSVLQWAYAKDPTRGFPPHTLPLHLRGENELEQRVFALWWFVFPNMAWNLYPWGLSLNAWYPVAGSPERTHFLWQHYVEDEEKYKRRNEWYGDDAVDREDTDALTLVGRGIRSRYAARQRFSPNREAAAHWFHRMLYVSTFN
jgi:choline monooxygenase